jgi:signal transduction histidine kinase
VRGDRRAALLSAVRAAYGLAAVAVVVVPLTLSGVSPSPLDVGVAWALLVAGTTLAARDVRGTALVGAAGLLWVLLVLVPADGSAPATALARLALMPTALLALAVMGAGSAGSRVVSRCAAAAVVLAAVFGGAGWYRFAVLAIGLSVLVVAWSRRRPQGERGVRIDASVLLQGAVGTGFTTAGALAALPMASERTITALHAAVMVLGSAGLCAVTSRSAPGVQGALALDTPEGLGVALGRALDRPPVSIALSTGDGRWLDAGGREVEPDAGLRPWHAADGALLARVSDPGDLDRRQRRAIDRFLAAAAHGARLRADLRDRAAALDGSRDRLLTAAADERARLATLIERGPLDRLDRLDALTPLVRDDPVLATRRHAARSGLRSVLRGLDPTAAGLEAALRALASDCGARVRPDSTWPAPGHLDPARARAVWFVCAEALANAAKHCPGAQVELGAGTTADAVEVVVRDRGPGGADPAGSGLSGLSGRAASVGGRLRVRSDPAGTEVAVWVPTAAGSPAAPAPTTSTVPRMPSTSPAVAVTP